jgi:hypothetical protein
VQAASAVAGAAAEVEDTLRRGAQQVEPFPMRSAISRGSAAAAS